MPSQLLSPLLLAAVVSLIVIILLRHQSLRRTEQSHRPRRSISDPSDLGGLEAVPPIEVSPLSGFSKIVEELNQQLHKELTVRQIPNEIRDFVDRIFQPDEVVILIRRKPSSTDPDKEHHLTVASSKEAIVPTGKTIRLGTGQMGRAARAGCVLDQPQLEALLEQFSPGEVDTLSPFRASLSAPMSIGETGLGVIAISQPRSGSDAGLTLGLVGQTAAAALSNAIALSEIRSEAEVDPLTRVYHKGAMTQRLDEAVAKADADDTDLSVFLMDIDHFKKYNDTNGHLAGDALLKRMVELVCEELRAENIFGRFGGEEFLLILPRRSAETANYIAEGIRQRIARFRFCDAGEQPLGKVTISGGIASLGHVKRTPTDLLTNADAALYRAKRLGRNHVLAVSA